MNELKTECDHDLDDRHHDVNVATQCYESEQVKRVALY